jgi:translation initiation factor IF-2
MASPLRRGPATAVAEEEEEDSVRQSPRYERPDGNRQWTPFQPRQDHSNSFQGLSPAHGERTSSGSRFGTLIDSARAGKRPPPQSQSRFNNRQGFGWQDRKRETGPDKSPDSPFSGFMQDAKVSRPNMFQALPSVASAGPQPPNPTVRRLPSSRAVTGFDAFAQAVGATAEQANSAQSPRPRSDRRRSQPHTPRSSRTDRGQTNVPLATDPDLDLDGLSRSELDEDIDSTHRKKLGKRQSRSDRYADEDDDLAEPNAASQRKTVSNDTRRMEELEAALLDDEPGRGRKKKKQAKKSVQQHTQPRLEIPEFITVQSLARSLGLRLEEFMDKLEEEGFEGARHDHLLDSGTSSMFAELYGYEPILATIEAQQDLVARPPAEDPSHLPQRPPIVTIMGHVDHGKTTILDYLRKANVVASEHGGITQHIGAFSVVMPGSQRRVTFLDTPGHAAFLDMRRRGANVTDIVVLVVAADDSVKPQTEEAIKHALEAGVHIIVAINKVDKPEADIDKVKNDLTRYNIVVEDLGGDYQAVPLSGKTGKGMNELEEAILALTDISDFRVERDGPAEGWIIESKVTTAGRVATVLVRRGTLRPGDFIVAGTTWARVRTLRNDLGDLVDEAPPGTPVQIDGWRGDDPTAGLEVLQADDEQHAKDVVDIRIEKAEALRNLTDTAAINVARAEAAEAREKVVAWQAEQGFQSRRQARIRLRDSGEGWIDTDKDNGPKKVHFIVKADVAGSTEAVVGMISDIGNNEVQANVIHSGTGMLAESDIKMLATTGEVGYAINFNQPIDGTMYRLAEAAGLEIIDHNVIYKVTDAVKERVAAELPPLITTKVLGEAEVGKIFDISVKKTKVKIAGCRVTNGTIDRTHKVRVQRGDKVVYTGSLDSLKNVKKDVTEMRKGTECGMAFEDWEDFQEGDKVQCFEEISEKRTLY